MAVPGTLAVLSVGQCGADEPRIQRMLRRVFPGIKVHAASSSAEALALLLGGDVSLVLINRVLDATGESGQELLVQVLRTSPAQKVMLVSNYEDAQWTAQKAGALPGFGKATLESSETEERIRAALSTSSTPRSIIP